MSEIACTMKISLIREHLIARKDGMNTMWSDYFITDTILSSWYQFFISNNYSYDRITQNDKNVDFLFPIRCFSKELITDGKLYWKIRGIHLEFTDMEYYIISHCSGKLSVFEIAERAHKYFKQVTVSFERILDDIVNYINELSEQLLVINRRLR
jgi:hypothetical protein